MVSESELMFFVNSDWKKSELMVVLFYCHHSDSETSIKGFLLIEKEKIMKKKYNERKGILITNEVLSSFGRRRSFLIQFMLDLWETSVKENKLINGYAFLAGDELFKKTTFNIKTSMFKNLMIEHKLGNKLGFLETETFGVDDGIFFKINISELYEKIMPLLKERINQNKINQEKEH